MKYSLIVETKNGDMLLNNIVLEGKYDELCEKMKDITFVDSLDIDQRLYFNQFKLIKIYECDSADNKEFHSYMGE